MPRLKRTVTSSRGLGRYGPPVTTDHGHTVRVQDSSAWGLRNAWVFIEGPADFKAPEDAARQIGGLLNVQTLPQQGVGQDPAVHDVRLPQASMGVHLTARQARSLIKRLQLWLETQEGR